MNVELKGRTMKRTFTTHPDDNDKDGRRNPLSKTLGAPFLNYEFPSANLTREMSSLRFNSIVRPKSCGAPTGLEDSDESLSPGRKTP